MDFGALDGLEYETLGLGLSIRRMEIEVSSFNTVRGQEYDFFFFFHAIMNLWILLKIISYGVRNRPYTGSSNSLQEVYKHN